MSSLVTISWSDVVAVMPAAATLTDTGAQAAILASVGREIVSPAWGDEANDAAVYLAAHLFALSKNRGGGVVTAESIGNGSMARSYAAPPVGVDALETTVWGREYVRRRSLIPDFRLLVV